MSAATYDEVVEFLGDIDDLFVERIIDVGATTEQIAEAVDELEHERCFAELRQLDGAPTVLAVRAILAEAFDDGDPDDWAPMLDTDPQLTA